MQIVSHPLPPSLHQLHRHLSTMYTRAITTASATASLPPRARDRGRQRRSGHIHMHTVTNSPRVRASGAADGVASAIG